MELIDKQEEIVKPPLERVRKPYQYEKHLENNVLRNAIRSGYFHSLTIENILVQYKKCIDGQKGQASADVYLDNGEVRIKSKREKLGAIAFLNLFSLKLRTIAEIGACSNLTACDLSCNFIKKIEALRGCKCLRKLDLHHNQIIELPEQEFWTELANLQMLYLHDNGISSFSEVAKMSTAQSLLLLTMYDTPVSLKVYYRHFIANSIWSLKALDHVVLSDEEIIEDGRFSARFQAMQPQFFFKPQSLEKQGRRTIGSEIRALHMDIAVVNRIQAKHCPVLILQRFTRGLLARLRYHYERDRRLWAAVKIQRFYRAYCGISAEQNPEYDTSLFNLISKNLDYDTYARYRRSRERMFEANAVLPSIASKRSSAVKLTQGIERVESKVVKSYTDSGVIKSVSSGGTIPLIISGPSLSISAREAKSEPAHKSTQLLGSIGASVEAGTHMIGRLPRTTLFERQKHILSQRMKNLKIDDTLKSTQEDVIVNDSEDSPIAFRLVGLPAPKLECDIMEDLVKCIVEGARDIREHAREHEMKRAMEPKPIVKKHRTITADQKLFIRTHGTMALSSLRAVDQAYKDRDRAKSLAAKIQQNQMEKQKRDLMVKRREHVKHVFVQKLRDVKRETKNQHIEALELQKSELLERKESVAIKRNERERTLQMRKRALALAAEFCNQANAINKALGSHAAMTAKEKRVGAKREKVVNIKEDIGRQKEIIRRYTEHQNLLLRSEVALSRSKLDADLHERAIEHRMEAQRHVRKLKGEREDRETRFPVLCTAPSDLPPLGVVSETQMDVWEELPKNEFVPREHDRVNSWWS